MYFCVILEFRWTQLGQHSRQLTKIMANSLEYLEYDQNIIYLEKSNFSLAQFD